MSGQQWAAVFVRDEREQAEAFRGLRAHSDARVIPWPPVAAQTIERSAFIAALDSLNDDDQTFDQDELYQAVLQLLKPVDGAVLSPEESADAAQALWQYVHSHGGMRSFQALVDRSRILAERLEAGA